MTDYLIKRFVPNYEKIDDINVRTRYGFLSGTVGIIINLILCTVKMVMGILSGSISIVGDAIHNLADGGASVVTMLGFKMASRPADQEHPFGHGRIEYIAGLIIAMAIILIGFELLKVSVEKIINPEEIVSSPYTIVILTLSVIFQLWLGLFNKGLGERINSKAMMAASVDSLSDCAATVVVIICQVLHFFSGIDLDAQAGVVVALFILHSGWGAARDTLQPLLGEPPDPEFIRGIRCSVLHEPRFIGVHDLMVHNYGPGRVFVSLHVEVPSTMNIMEAHDIVDDLEDRLGEEFNAAFTVHMDPIVVDDPRLNKLKDDLRMVAEAIDPRMSVHDVRLVSNGKLVLDVAAPYSCRLSDSEIINWIKKEMDCREPGCRLVIKVDRMS